jgi:two-component system NtrC family sensor kinase
VMPEDAPRSKMEATRARGARIVTYNRFTESREAQAAGILKETGATWHAMLDDHREMVYQMMQTIAERQGVDRIRMVNRSGQVMYSTRQDEQQQGRMRLDRSSQVRVFRAPNGERRLDMLTPIYNERSCSQAQCHAHPEGVKQLGMLDLSLSLENVDREMDRMKARVLVVTAVEIALISIFIIFFTRRFLSRPIDRLIAGTKAVSQMELDEPINIVGSSEELDQLARAFDLMRERLRTAMAENNEFTHNLESKVEKRTEQLKAAQKKLVQSDRLASLGQLSASVAHEINNPVSGVLNLAMLMQRMVKEDGVPHERLPEFRKYLGQVISETSRVGRIVSDLLAFSRRGKPQRAPADLNKIVRMTLSLVQHKLKLSNVAVESLLRDDLPAVPCDASQIQQVVLNVVLNAAEATHNKALDKNPGHITVETYAADGLVWLTVTDNGDGIPPENLTRIFDPFFTTKSDGKGVGLGLAVSYGIIQAHGGDIEARNNPGGGATFAVSLPLEQPALAAGQTAAQGPLDAAAAAGRTTPLGTLPSAGSAGGG